MASGVILNTTQKFQSTLPRRERQIVDLSVPFLRRFQSTLPRRERLYGYKVSRFGVPFQSTLPRRERHVVQSVFTGDPLFQSTLPRRERRSRVRHRPMLLPYFNPRSREGSDSTRVLKCQAYFYFNPRSREGSDTASQFTG